MEDIEINRYEVGSFINGNRNTYVTTNNIQEAEALYVKVLDRLKKNSAYKFIVFLFDYDKNTNIEYYDNQAEIS